jgi:hypothetical protein
MTEFHDHVPAMNERRQRSFPIIRRSGVAQVPRDVFLGEVGRGGHIAKFAS